MKKLEKACKELGGEIKIVEHKPACVIPLSKLDIRIKLFKPPEIKIDTSLPFEPEKKKSE